MSKGGSINRYYSKVYQPTLEMSNTPTIGWCLQYVSDVYPHLYAYVMLLARKLKENPRLLVAVPDYTLYREVSEPSTVHIYVDKRGDGSYVEAGCENREDRVMHVMDQGRVFVHCEGGYTSEAIEKQVEHLLTRGMYVDDRRLDIWITGRRFMELGITGLDYLGCGPMGWVDGKPGGRYTRALRAYLELYDTLLASVTKSVHERISTLTRRSVGGRDAIDEYLWTWVSMLKEALFRLDSVAADAHGPLLTFLTTVPWSKGINLSLEDVLFVHDILIRYHQETAKAVAQHEVDRAFGLNRYQDGSMFKATGKW